MASVVRYVDTSSSGGDGTTQNHSGATAAYVSLSAWEAAEQTDLVSAGDTHTVYCAGGADTTTCTVNGWTTGASNRLKIAGDPTAPDGDGVNPDVGFSTSYYYKEVTGGGTNALQIRDNYVDVEDLQFRNSNASGTNTRCIQFGALPSGVDNQVNRCRFDNNSSTASARLVFSSDADQDVTFNACLFDMEQNGVTQSGSHAIYVFLGDFTFNNCTFVKETRQGSDFAGALYGDPGVTITAKNCAIAGFDDDTAGPATFTLDYNASDDTDGTNAVDISPGADPDGWEDAFTTWGSDWTIKDTDSVLYDAGLNSAIPATDLLGNTYTTDDIGCFAFVGGDVVGSGLLDGLKLSRMRLAR